VHIYILLIFLSLTFFIVLYRPQLRIPSRRGTKLSKRCLLRSRGFVFLSPFPSVLYRADILLPVPPHSFPSNSLLPSTNSTSFEPRTLNLKLNNKTALKLRNLFLLLPLPAWLLPTSLDEDQPRSLPSSVEETIDSLWTQSTREFLLPFRFFPGE